MYLWECRSGNIITTGQASIAMAATVKSNSNLRASQTGVRVTFHVSSQVLYVAARLPVEGRGKVVTLQKHFVFWEFTRIVIQLDTFEARMRPSVLPLNPRASNYQVTWPILYKCLSR